MAKEPEVPPEDPMRKYGYLRGWEWWQPKPRGFGRGAAARRQERGGWGRAQAKAAAAGYSSVDEWEAAGWPHPIDPETGRSYEGYKIDRMERGRHPDGRKMADEDWFDLRTQNIFDYLRGAQVYSTHYEWADKMRARYPNYPMPGINMDELLRQMFPDWYDGEEEPAPPPTPREVPLPTRETFETMMPAGARAWMERLGLEVPEGVRRAPEDRALPIERMPEAEREEQRRAIREGRAGPRAWAGYIEREERKPTTWRDYLRGEEPPAEEAPVAPRPLWEGMEDLLERAKEMLTRPEITEPLPRPEEVAVGVGKILVSLPILPAVVAEALVGRLSEAIPAARRLAEARPRTAEKIIATSLLPAEWVEYAIGQGMLRSEAVKRVGEPPERWKDDPKTIAEYELGNLLASLDDETREKMINSLARIAWSTPIHHVNAARRLIDPTEYENWARYEGELVEIKPGTTLKEGYAPVDMWDPDVVTQILRQEEWVLGEFFFRSILDPLNLFYIPEVQQAPGAVWRRLTGKRTPAQYGRQIFTDYYGPGEEIPAYVEDFLASSKGKPSWWQKAWLDNIRDIFQPLTSRYAAWKVRGAPPVVMGLPEKAGDLTSYMRAAAKAEDEIARSYALVYPRAGTSDPNFLQVIAKTLSAGLNPAQVREMRVLLIEAENYREFGNLEGAEEKVRALEKIAQQGLSLKERWKLLYRLSRTKAGSMSLLRNTPAASREIMADNATRVLGWMFEDMPSGIDRAVATLLLKKDPQQLVKEFPWIDSLPGLNTFRILQHIRDESLGSYAFATGVPSTNIQGGWTQFHEAFRRVAGTYHYPSPRPDLMQRMIGQFYRIAPRTFLSTGRYPLQNIVSNFTNIWTRYGWVTPRTDASSLAWVNRFLGDAGFLPPGFARSITAAGEVSTERIPTLLGRKWVYEGPTTRGREAPSEEALAAAREVARGPSPVGWAKRLVKKGAAYLPFGEGWIDLSKWGERNASMANYRDVVDTIKGEFGRPGRGFLPTVPEGVEASLEMRDAIEEIIASSWNWGEIIEGVAKLYGVEVKPQQAHFVSTERIRNLGAEAIEVADDLMESLTIAPSKAAFQRRYRLIKKGVGKHVGEWIAAEPDFPEMVELPRAPLEGLTPEQAQRLMALTGTAERNRGHILNGRRILIELAEKNREMAIEDRYRLADVIIDKALRDYMAAGKEATRMTDSFWATINDGRLWPAQRDKINKMHRTAHENIDKSIHNAAMRLGGDSATVREELELFPWGGLPEDMADRKMRALQDDLINAAHEMQAWELPLAPEGVVTPPLDSIRAIKDWAQENPLAANAWLEYMAEAIEEKALAEAVEVVARTPAEEIKRARRASWREGTARQIELMEQKIARLQEEIATSPVAAADIEQLTTRQQELYGMAMELEAVKDTLTSLPTQKEVFRFWDYKEGAFRKVKDPSGRVAEFAQSQIVQEIAYKHYGLQQGVAGAEQFGEMIRQRLEMSNRVATLENLIWEEPELILPETAEGLEKFIAQSEPQLEQMMLYEREPHLFQTGLRHYEEAVDRLAKIRAGEAMPESVVSKVENAKAEIAKLEREREAIRLATVQRNRIPVSPEERVMLAQDLQALNEQYVAKGIVKRNRLGQGPLFEDLEELRERGFFKRTVRGPRKADKARAIPKIGYEHYFYTLTDEGRQAVKGISIVRMPEIVPKPEPPGSRVEPELPEVPTPAMPRLPEHIDPQKLNLLSISPDASLQQLIEETRRLEAPYQLLKGRLMRSRIWGPFESFNPQGQRVRFENEAVRKAIDNAHREAASLDPDRQARAILEANVQALKALGFEDIQEFYLTARFVGRPAEATRAARGVPGVEAGPPVTAAEQAALFGPPEEVGMPTPELPKPQLPGLEAGELFGGGEIPMEIPPEALERPIPLEMEIEGLTPEAAEKIAMEEGAYRLPGVEGGLEDLFARAEAQKQTLRDATAAVPAKLEAPGREALKAAEATAYNTIKQLADEFESAGGWEAYQRAQGKWPEEPWQVSREEYTGPSWLYWGEKSAPAYYQRQYVWEQATRAAVSEGRLSPEAAKGLGLLKPGLPTQYGLQQRLGQWQPLPQDQPLYHVTTAKSAVMAEGLKSRFQLGLDRGPGLGGGEETAISFSLNKEMAQVIENTLKEARKVARGDITIDDLIRMADEGEGAERPWAEDWFTGFDRVREVGDPIPWELENLRTRIERVTPAGKPAEEMVAEGWEVVESSKTWPATAVPEIAGKPADEGFWIWQRPMSEEDFTRRVYDAYNRWLWMRQEAGGPENPVFFSADFAALAQVPEEEIALLEFRAKAGAMGTQMSGLNEWRTYSGGAVEPVTPGIPAAEVVVPEVEAVKRWLVSQSRGPRPEFERTITAATKEEAIVQAQRGFSKQEIRHYTWSARELPGEVGVPRAGEGLREDVAEELRQIGGITEPGEQARAITEYAESTGWSVDEVRERMREAQAMPQARSADVILDAINAIHARIQALEPGITHDAKLAAAQADLAKLAEEFKAAGGMEAVTAEAPFKVGQEVIVTNAKLIPAHINLSEGDQVAVTGVRTEEEAKGYISVDKKYVDGFFDPKAFGPVTEPIEPRVAAEVPEGAREPWQMSREEYWEWAKTDHPNKRLRSLAKSPQAKHEGSGAHISLNVNRKADIRKALSEGKSVPPEVLADYPDMVPEAPKPELPRPAEILREKGVLPAYERPAPPAVDMDEVADMKARALEWLHGGREHGDMRALQNADQLYIEALEQEHSIPPGPDEPKDFEIPSELPKSRQREFKNLVRAKYELSFLRKRLEALLELERTMSEAQGMTPVGRGADPVWEDLVAHVPEEFREEIQPYAFLPDHLQPLSYMRTLLFDVDWRIDTAEKTVADIIEGLPKKWKKLGKSIEPTLADLAKAPEEPAGIPTMITQSQREILAELGYNETMIGQMTPDQAQGLIQGRLKDFAPDVETPFGPMADLDPVMPPSPREGAELKRDLLIERMDEWYKDVLKVYGKEIESDPTNFGNVNQWLENDVRGHWGQMKMYMDKMGEATTAWTLYNYRKLNIDTLMYRGFWWPYWQTRTGHRWLTTFLENPAKLALWARWHDTHRKINEDLPENYKDTVHIPDWVPVIGGQHWNPYFFFDPIYAWMWSLDNFVPTWKRDGLLSAMVTSTPISPLLGMREWLQPMITEEGRRMEPVTPWSRALYEKTGINIEAAAIKGLETLYGEVKPSIYSAMEKGGQAVGRPGLAERVLGGPGVQPIITEGRYRPTYIVRVLLDMWLAEEITDDEFNEAMSTREGSIWDQAIEEVKRERGLTEFSSIYTGIRARRLHPSEYEIEEFKRQRGIIRTMEEGPEKREYREQFYDNFPWGRQYDVRYDSVESAKQEAVISEAWMDIENEAVISEKKLADAIRSRPGDLAYEYEVKQENREREETKRAFWMRQGVSFVFNPRTRSYEEIEDWVSGQILGQFYYHLPQAERFKDEEGAIDWDAYNEAVEAFWEDLPRSIVKWEDIERLDQEVGDAIGTRVNVLSLAQAVATEEAYDEWRKANDIPEEALNYIWKKYIIDVANEFYQEELKDLEYDERNMPAFFGEFGHKTAEDLMPYILKEYPGRWTEEELTERLTGMTMPGIWEQWNQDGDERSTAISLLWAFWGGQTGLGRRRMKELLNSPIYNQYFVDKEGRNYERITNEELEGWLKELNVPNPWDDNDGALRTLYYWTVDSTGDPLLYKDEEPEARGRAPGMAAPMPLEPPTPEEEEPPPPEPLRTIPQLAGTGESAQYAQAQDEMAAWVAGGKEGDWTPLMEQWFGKDTPAGFFWEYYWAEIPPGRIADDVRSDPIIEMLLNKAFRTVYDVKEGAYEAALETLQTWREAHPELPGDPKEWAIVRQIVKKYWELREAGAENEARAIWMYFATLLEPYYPSKPAPTRRRGIPAYMRRGRGGGGGGRKRGAFLTRWRRWANIRYYPPKASR